MSALPLPTLRPLRRQELDTLIEWAAAEGWNPGLDDAEVFWATDPDGFVAAELDLGAGPEFVGGGSIVRYQRRYGFMGFFIVRSDLRGRGLGTELWFHRRDLLRSRLDADAPIEMDGVFAMQPWYAKGGFVFRHRDLRFEGIAKADLEFRPHGRLVNLADLPFDLIDAYDRRHFPAPRPEFLRRWISRPGGHAIGLLRGDSLAGCAVTRPCRRGHKIGPLFADDAGAAESLLSEIGGRLDGETVQLDVPEVNAAAVEIATRHGMAEVFGCARMTLGSAPTLPWNEIFGVTTFELG
jgi:GNAT superfamily N-acetyltransferase